MQATLTPADTVYDIGTEHGWLAALIAQWCGAIALLEPSPFFWPNIRLTWEANNLPDPIATFPGLVGTVTELLDTIEPTDSVWPVCSIGPELTEGMPYRYIHSHPNLPQTRLDDFSLTSDTTPTVLNIDVEGAELLVLLGAPTLLSHIRPRIYISVHPDLMARDYDHHPADLTSLLRQHDYRGELLAIDHEEHWLYLPL